MGTEYFAGYVTEKALSVDNLFVFLIIMTSFAVPRADQQKVLLFGIVFSIVARTGFIFLGAALINSFAWVFYLFGLILLITAGNMLKPEGEDSHSGDNIMVRIAQKLFRTTDRYDGDKLVTVENGRRVLTRMAPVMAAIGGTDVLFALDSIPAIYGLTENVYIVFTATVFSLLGLRQLFFLIDGRWTGSSTSATGWPRSSPSSASNSSCTPCTRTTCRSSTTANRSTSSRSAPGSPSASSSVSCG